MVTEMVETTVGPVALLLWAKIDMYKRQGISGVPGAGKSTSIDVFGLHVLEKGGKLAVLA